MKKTKVVILFFLGILLGGGIRQLGHELQTLRQPLIQEGKIDITSLINSIKQVIHPEALCAKNSAYERFDTIYTILQTAYYDTNKLHTGKMLNNALKAYVDALDDPYTIYMDSEQHSGFQEELKGEMAFEGIGAVISKKDYYIQIDELIKGGPAFQAGLLILDRILMINTGSTKDLDVNEAVKRIRGPKGTKVTLTIERINKDGTKEVFEKTITRDTINIPSVTSKIFTGTKGQRIGYINISIIGEETENLLKKTINEFKQQHIQGLLLDLRGNGGGLLPVAVTIASHFIPKGKTIVTTKYTVFEDEIMVSEGYYDFKDIPIVVLVDRLTASAGEIIALALQHHVGATLVGTTTFGKGSIQTMADFDDGASLKYTVGKRYAPNGINIDKTGITPDVTIEFDSERFLKEGYDNQLEKAKEILFQLLHK